MALQDYLHISTPARPGEPLIFTFHGTGGDEHQFPGLIAKLRPGAGVVSPRGDVSEHGAARFFRRTGEGVYDMADLARATAKMAGFIAAHKAANPGAPVWALGYSNGANILASVLFAQPELIDRAVLMHPLIPFTPADQPGLAGREILITAGRRDPICPAPLTESLQDWLAAQGANVQTEWSNGGHQVDTSEINAIGRFLAA
ncbi:alpha/beta hydrolase [Phaeovulum sp. W22_SRMD_FR3]|uniref:alpha/beta hydrolase n=1 Tax=Phaeovulum sp. W22_SRMD_FR3 TaxID=3240274 RepID=UPI003F9C2BF0